MTPTAINPWQALPFHFWSVAYFAFGCIVGSFLNVCIHRMPRGESIISPPSHCPHCRYSIPWFLNVPLVTWLFLRGRCAHCGSPIAFRYFLVELLTGLTFLACWLSFGSLSHGLVLTYCTLLSGFIVATFIDVEHFIIPDEITLGGIAAGILCAFLVPSLHHVAAPGPAMLSSFVGAICGWGIIYVILELAKLAFGRQRYPLPPASRVYFSESHLHLPDRAIPYEEIFCRKSDCIVLSGSHIELPDRCYLQAKLRLWPNRLQIDADAYEPEHIGYLTAVTDEVVVPREAMGFGDVKFMAAIGAFLGWQAVLFSLLFSSLLGSIVGITLIALKRQAWSNRIPYGPYIAAAATCWIFGGRAFVLRWFALP